jgi:hypothetical protein
MKRILKPIGASFCIVTGAVFESRRLIRCDSSKVEYLTSPERKQHREQMIDQYINEMLKNPELNIREIPDAIERQIYKFTLKMTLDSIFKWVCLMDGLKVLGHQVRLDFVPAKNPTFVVSSLGLNKNRLHDFVTILLQEDLVNISWLTDAVEHRLYFNCLILIFTALQSFLGTTELELLGHKLSFNLTPHDADIQKIAKQTLIRRRRISEAVIDDMVDKLMNR